MSAERVTYLDSSAIVKLAVREPESGALRRYLRRKRPLVTSALARTEVARALLAFGATAIAHGQDTLNRLDVVRVNDRILRYAGTAMPVELRCLDAIHLATAAALGADLARVCTYDERMATAATALGMSVVAPS
jgi:uncharacterized protein